ncbi:MAG: class I tRNA ligase family protein, partial [Candidatus Bipolaricaulia bacterium]
MPGYDKLEGEVTQYEERVLLLWEEQRAFERSLKQRERAERWVFYEGPPTANGRPHFGHLLPRVYKDLFPRYKTMRGYYVGRKGGWDTHGLPVELEVEKELGLNSKGEIERYGVERFIAKCKESVWRYKSEWEQMIRRMGFWIDLDDAYITYTNEYIETVWWALKKIWAEGLLYRGHKVLPYCPRCGTPLSSHEVAQGYRTVKDPSVSIKLPIIGSQRGSQVQEPGTWNLEPETAFLVWTTTPWTLPANTALAVGPDFTYAKVRIGDETLIMAEELLDRVL